MENKEKSSLLYKLLILTAIAVPLIIGSSYAYFLAVIEGAENPTTMNGSSVSTFDFNLITDNGGYINATDTIPITDANRSTQGNIGTFKVTTGSNVYDVNYSITLTDIIISDPLKISNFKWELVCTSCANTNNNASGNFSTYTSGDLVLKNNLVIAPNSEESYKLIIWLSENNSDQTSLMNQSFRAKIQATGEFLISNNQG